MTFDTSTDAGTGFNGVMGDASTANATTGKAGLWSYIVGSWAVGMPSGCTTGTKPQEVGARNSAAPPWEGRMVNFGNPNDGVRDYLTRNKHIQEVLLATRPYGATPIAGMMKDARDFLLNDKSVDADRNPSSLPTNDAAADFGPWQDPFQKCRSQAIVLLTDGAPNMDLRPYCASSAETPAGVCPFDLPEDIAADLDQAAGGHKEIPTYVVGFGLDQVDDDNNPVTAPLDCNTLLSIDQVTGQLLDSTKVTDPNGVCQKVANANNVPLQACCTLQRIALAGGKRTSTDPATNSTTTRQNQAYFASNHETLKSQLATILSDQQKATSRTQPVQSGSGGGTFRFFTGFNTGHLTPWSGTLERQRFECKTVSGVTSASGITIDKSSGDNFVHNLAIGGPNARRVYTVLGGATVSDPITSQESIRPSIGSTDPDGVGTYGGRQYSGTSLNFINSLPPTALAIPTARCVDQNGVALASASVCRDMYLKWWLGYDNGQASVASRCPSVGNEATCKLMGDIIHSTPLSVDRPNAAIRDESYARYALLQATRPLMLYVSSNDGLLHAFKVRSNVPSEASDAAKNVLNDGQSNELWTFAPPAVLPNLYQLYPFNHQVLLDGIAAVQDVVAVQPSQADEIPTVFERTATDARSGAAAWRTVMVQGFGATHSGYFALDVTSPELSTSAPDDVTKGGPRMLWQLTRDSHGNNLFGRGGATPLITTLYVDPSGGTDPKEIPVAVLPGGPGGTPVTTGPGCPASGRSYTGLPLDTDYPPRPRVHCYNFPSDEAGARSLTIVRLDTGEIIRTFRLSKTDVAAEIQPRTTEAELDAPITGQPVAFPGFVGQVADRVFVGDADGRLFKVDLASANPADWTMKLFFDLYPDSIKSTATSTFDSGQPLVLPPSVSVDPHGDVVIAAASGDQEVLLSAPTAKNYLFSLTEKVNPTRTGTSTSVNWYQSWTKGEHVVGPMVLFDSWLYFATYLPPDAADSACGLGLSSIRQASYLDRKDPLDSTLGPAVLKLLDSFTAVTAGVAGVQDRDCSTTGDDTAGDPVLGYGHQVGLSQVNPGKFKLIYQTGNQASGSTGASVGVREVELPPPPTLSSIQSWASIVE